MSFQEILERVRDNLSGSANAVAREFHVSPPSVLNWFWGTTLPGPDKLERIAEIAGLTLEDVEEAWLQARRARDEARLPRPRRGGAGLAVPLPVESKSEEIPLIRLWKPAA